MSRTWPLALTVRNGFEGAGAVPAAVSWPRLLSCCSFNSSASGTFAPAARSTRSSCATSTLNPTQLRCRLTHVNSLKRSSCKNVHCRVGSSSVWKSVAVVFYEMALHFKHSNSVYAGGPDRHLRHAQADVHTIRVNRLLDKQDLVGTHEHNAALAKLLQRGQKACTPNQTQREGQQCAP